jgi:hypothetical protein
MMGYEIVSSISPYADIFASANFFFVFVAAVVFSPTIIATQISVSSRPSFFLFDFFYKLPKQLMVEQIGQSYL